MILLALATIVAHPGQIPVALASARPGDTISVRPGDHGAVRIANKAFKPRVTVQIAKGARLTLAVTKSSGFTFRGGSYGPARATGPAGYAVNLVQAADVSFFDGTVTDSTRGLVMSQSRGIVVQRMTFTGMRVDGVNIASSQKVMVADNLFRDFRTGETHPDAIQAWSRPATGVTADVQILRNRIEGPGMQGVFFGNHVRAGVNDGGFDRVTIRGNRVSTNFPNGILVSSCRACAVEDNEVATTPGAKWRTSINVGGGSVTVARNVVAEKPR